MVPEALQYSRAHITYVPLRTEVSFREFFPIPEGSVIYEIAPRASLDPREEALNVMKAVGDMPAVIFMPGKRFDPLGTRHGQGGGWYDRFLARVPSLWIRVGFCTAERFSQVPLKRNDWDEPVDYVCVDGAWYTTNARKVVSPSSS